MLKTLLKPFSLAAKSFLQPYVARLNIVLDNLACLTVTTKTRNQDSLIIVKPDAIGDFLLVWPDLKRIRKALPELYVTLVISEVNEPLKFLAKEVCNELHIINVKKFRWSARYRFNKTRELKRWKYSLGVNFQVSRVFDISDALTKNSADHIVGWEPDFANITKLESLISDDWYSEFLKQKTSMPSEIEKNREMADRIIGFFGSQIVDYERFSIDTEDEVVSCGDRKIVVVAPGASWEGKRWPLERFGAVLGLISERINIEIFIVGSVDEVQICNRLEEIVRCPVTNLVGKKDLRDIISLLSSASLVIGNDSALIHMAALVNAPSIVIYGGGHFRRFFPYPSGVKHLKQPVVAFEYDQCFGCNWVCRRAFSGIGAYPCIEDVGAERIFRLAESALVKS
jgi:ADP-heptose:LPS heptosyltransferase